MVYKYCYSNSYLTKIYVEKSVTDIMKHPVQTVIIKLLSKQCKTRKHMLALDLSLNWPEYTR